MFKSCDGLHESKQNMQTLLGVRSMDWKSFLRWLKTVSSSYILMGRYNHSLSHDATIMVSQNCPFIGEQVVTIFMVTIETV